MLVKAFGGLGLKELRIFNLTMLFKQGWRLLVEAIPLVSALMKARYYPDKCFLNANMGKNPSYVWHGLMTALEAVKAGARRQIGNGEDTFVWSVP